MRHNILTLSLLLVAICAVKAQTIMNIHQSNGTVLQIPVNTIDSITYTISNPGNLASITTTAVSNITGTTAVSGGNITNNGGSLVTQRGVCYSTSANPTTANSTIISGSGIGSFTSNLTGLTANTTYYVRAYAINSAGTAYGNQVSFTTTSGGSGIVSNPGPGVTYNGYNYPTIILGNGQEWMSQNLRTTQYSDGTAIPLVTDPNQWAANYNNGTTLPMMCWYNNDQASYTANNFGALYNWYAVNPLTNGNKNVCPAGWHVPTDAEWSTFINYLDPNADGGNNPNIAGGKMKSTGTQYWLSPNQDATNESGFSGHPCGYRSSIGTLFSSVGSVGNWWSSMDFSSDYAWVRYLNYDYGSAGRNYSFKTGGLSVRCLRD
jgi:uncharacterized protein (TIGR02145 family)